MLLGEGLALRADLQKRMKRLRSLLLENATVQEGDRPSVDPSSLLGRYREIAREHEVLVRRINRTNVEVHLELFRGGMTLADAVVRRERLPADRGETPPHHGRGRDAGTIYRLSREHRELDIQVELKE